MGHFISSWTQLVDELASLRRQKNNPAKSLVSSVSADCPRVVFTNGCFDILHVGHVRYLREAKLLGDILVVGLNTDASVRRLKGPNRPVQTELHRAEILAALQCVDFVVLFEQETPLELIQAIRPDILVKGGDYNIENIVGSSFVISYGGQVKSLQFINDISTSKIIAKSQENYK